MKAIVQTGIGEPVDVLSLREVPAPAPADDGIVIDVSLASVHHGDLFFIRSVRALPDGTKHIGSGIEAVGRVRSIGGNVAESKGLKVGDRAAVSLVSGAWAEQVAVPAVHAFPVPDDIPDTTAAQLFISALTARMVVRAIQRSVPDKTLRNGAVLLTGASTAVARIIAHFMLQQGLTTVGLTRSEATAVRTGALVPGVPFVATESEGWQDRLRRFVSRRPLRAVADCVSGVLLRELNPLLADEAAIIIYGGLDPNPVGLTGLDITARQFELRGVTVGRWFTETNSELQQEDAAASIALARAHPELFPVAGTYGLQDWREAIAAVERPGREGFILLALHSS